MLTTIPVLQIGELHSTGVVYIPALHVTENRIMGELFNLCSRSPFVTWNSEYLLCRIVELNNNLANKPTKLLKH